MRLKRFILIPLSLLAILSIAAVKSDFALVRDTEIVINMMRALEQNYVDTLSTSQLLKDATRGMARSLDPYTSYLSEEDMGDFEIMTTGRYGGIGSVIRKAEEYVTIAQPYRDSPADKAGLKIGDQILEINGESAKGFDTKEVSDRLKGVPGSSVTMTVRSILDSTERRVKIRRERIAIPSVPYYGMVSDSVGYINHSEFIDGSYEELRAALSKLKESNMQALILDYRGNGGGIMQEAIKTLSLFVPKESPVLVVKGRRDSTVYRTTRDQLYGDLPIVVLIDGNTASAAEIVSGALQDMDRAVLIGEKSFGKGLVQSTIPVGYDSYLKLTTARYYIPSGRCIQALDYTDHSDSRSVSRVADSLKREFYTKAGRKVYDGGGITPDITLEGEYVSMFAQSLYAQGHIDKWGEQYYRRNHTSAIDPKSFTLPEEEFEEFKRVLKGRDVKFESGVSRAIKALESAAKGEKNDDILEQIKALKDNMHDDVEDNLERYREEIMDYMRQDVVLRMCYSEGVICNSLTTDNQVARAVELLRERGEIEQLLSATPQ